MACSWVCCGSFCLFMSICCALLMFAFYGLLDSGTPRLAIGDSPDERKHIAKTALWTAITYVVFILISIGCIFGGGSSNNGYDEKLEDEQSESEPLFGTDPVQPTYESTTGTGAKSALSSGLSSVNAAGPTDQPITSQ